MGRPRDERRRSELVARTAATLLERGTTQLTLVELAQAAQESSRMLVHHFGSRDALVRQALAHARGDVIGAMHAELAGESGDLRALVAALRSIVGSPTNRPYFRLFAEVSAIARAQPAAFPGFRRASVHDWLPDLTRYLVEGGCGPSQAAAEATLALAIVRGLLLDEHATEDTARVQAAYDTVAGLCR